MRIKIISAYNEAFEDVGSISAKSIALYAIAHNMDYEIFKLENFDRPPAWSKIYYLMQEINKNQYDYILWVDADACFIRSDVNIADEIQIDKDMLMVNHFCMRRPMPDQYGLYVMSEIPNTGVLLLKSSTWCLRFLEKVWSDVDFLHHVWWEQSVFHKLMGYHFEITHGQFKNVPNVEIMAHIGWLNGIWNCVPTSSVGGVGQPLTINPYDPVIVHFAGMKNHFRLQEMRRLKLNSISLY
jgi:hypothetical protein